MLENKAASFAKVGDHTLARMTQMFSPVFVPPGDAPLADPFFPFFPLNLGFIVGGPRGVRRG